MLMQASVVKNRTATKNAFMNFFLFLRYARKTRAILPAGGTPALPALDHRAAEPPRSTCRISMIRKLNP
jgi:hypothetical protein